MSGMGGQHPSQKTMGRRECDKAMEKKGKAPPAGGSGGDGDAGARQLERGLRTLLESLDGEEFIVTVEFGGEEGDAGPA